MLCCPGVIFHTRKQEGCPPALGQCPIWHSCLGGATCHLGYLACIHIPDKADQSLQQGKPNHCNTKSNLSRWCVLYNNIFRKWKNFRLVTTATLFWVFEMKSTTKKVETDLLLANMMVQARFTFMNAVLCTGCLYWPGWEEKERFLNQETQDLDFNTLNNKYISKHLQVILQRIPGNFTEIKRLAKVCKG